MSQPPQVNTIHVVHLIKGLGPGGAERLIVNQLRTSDPTIRATVMRVVPAKSQLVSDVEAAGAATRVVGGGRFWPLALGKQLRAEDPDIVHAHSPLLAAAVRLLKRTRQISAPVVTTEHNRWPRHHWLTRALNRRTAAVDAARIAVSEDVRQSMDARLRSTTTVLDHGVPVEELVALRSSRAKMRNSLLTPAETDAVVVGIVANFRPEKAYDVFLNAVDHARQHTDDLHFLVIGQGPGEAAFRDEVRRRQLSEQVTVLGYRDDATEVMSAFDIFTLSSRHEGKPVSLMEAFALGLPVVATRAGGIPEAVTDGVDGLLVDIGDSVGLANGWIALAADEPARAAMGQAAGSRATSFDAAAATRSIESTYRSVLDGSGS